MKNISRMLLIATLSLSSTACQFIEHLVAPPHPQTAGWTKFQPPAWYRTLYVQVEECSGLHRNYESLRFYYHAQRDTSDHVRDSQGKPVYAMEDAWTRRIWIGSESLADPLVVQHEMMHYLLDGVGGHPPKYFDARCHLQPAVYDQADWVRDHDVMSAFYQSHGSLGLPVTSSGAPAGLSAGSSVVGQDDEGVPADAS